MTIDAWRQMEDDLLGQEPATYELAGPSIPDLAEADRALRRVARIRRDAAAEREAYEIQRAQLDSWYDGRLEHHGAALAYHLDRLERYHRAVLELDPKRKTITLPSGVLKARAQQPEWEYTDEAAFLAWAQVAAPEAVTYPPAPEPRIDRNAAKDVLTRRDAKGKPVQYGVTADGVVPPGLQVLTRGDKFDVEVHGG